jgi:hypothetical protein
MRPKYRRLRGFWQVFIAVLLLTRIELPVRLVQVGDG